MAAALIFNLPTEPVLKDATDAMVSDGNNPGEYYSRKLHMWGLKNLQVVPDPTNQRGVRGHVSAGRHKDAKRVQPHCSSLDAV